MLGTWNKIRTTVFEGEKNESEIQKLGVETNKKEGCELETTRKPSK